MIMEDERTWGLSDEQDERIRKVISDISDEDYLDAFEAWEDYLKYVLKLPFDAEVSEYQEKRQLKCGDKVIVNEFVSVEDPYGIIVKIIVNMKDYYFPLCDLSTIDKNSSNYKPLDDYSVWFSNR